MEKFGLSPTYWNGHRYIHENKTSQHRWKHEGNCILLTFEKFEVLVVNMDSISIDAYLDSSKHMCHCSPNHLWILTDEIYLSDNPVLEVIQICLQSCVNSRLEIAPQKKIRMVLGLEIAVAILPVD